VVDRKASGSVPGWSVSLSGHGTALVGEPDVLGGPGAVDVLHVSRTAESPGFSSISHARLTNAAGPPRDLFGADVGLSADGTTALVSSARGSFVFTQASFRRAPYCYVPYLDGKRPEAAKRAIEETHCRVGTVTRVSISRGQGDCVVAQRPEPGERLANGAEVSFRLGRSRRRA
jgi:hypothetical protein